MRFAIFGVGGVGGWLGACLQKSGADVVFIARGAHGEALRSSGLRLERAGDGPNKERELLVFEKVQAFSDAAAAVAAGVSVDCCILCVKTFQVYEAAAACGPLLSENGFVVTTQNGVEAPVTAAEALGSFKKVVGGSCKVLAHIAGPGFIQMPGSSGFFTFGEVYDSEGKEVSDARSPRVDQLLHIFRAAQGVAVEVGTGSPVPSMWRAIWEKAVSMCTNGPLGALTRASFDAVLACPESREMLRRSMIEVVMVAKARGVVLTDDPQAMVNGMLQMLGKRLEKGVTNSTTRDVVTGRPSEVRELSGAILRAAKQVGVAVPTHEFIYAALLPQERRAREEYHYDLYGVPGAAPHVAVTNATALSKL
eukprot:gnl/TRDRNA2_/TRDRNA2_33551_c0_seq1.p1 gnl/TRDRNA2_/TRDRNA2_33551_c0~~gnl/TRDRNA2_/TRDRNA2_33551_c0_seq1.p1  ORF type:complete len:365 (+),score=58.67 gnl/TRDRNA2_/TRDRNA2_33551_c0_seq1:62-1156(+)